jgi:hypothetical protein
MKDVIEIILTGIVLISPLLIFIVIWGTIAKLIKGKRKIKLPKEIHVGPKTIARRVIYKEELNSLMPIKGDIAYVIKEEYMYLYNGKEWTKIGQHGTVGN